MIGPVAAVLCVAVFTRAAAQRYEVVESGTCESHGLLQITNVAQCQTAVAQGRRLARVRCPSLATRRRAPARGAASRPRL